VFEGVVLAPLPYREPDLLVMALLYNRTLKYATYLSYPDFLDWQRGSRSFEQVAAFRGQGFDLTSPGAPEHVDGKEVSSSFFGTLGARLVLGRDFSPEEDRTRGMSAVVISNRLWQDRFSGSQAALGMSITLSGIDYTIVGVLQPEFRFGNQQADVYTPLGRGDPLSRMDRTIHDVASIARLKRDVNIGQARAEMNTVQEHIDELNPRPGCVYGAPETIPRRGCGRDASLADGICRFGIADRLCERRQSVAGAFGGAHSRVCGSSGAGSEPRTHRQAVDH
jgi:hypothetical protein